MTLSLFIDYILGKTPILFTKVVAKQKLNSLYSLVAPELHIYLQNPSSPIIAALNLVNKFFAVFGRILKLTKNTLEMHL